MMQPVQFVSTYKNNISVQTIMRGAQRLSSRVRSNGNSSRRGLVSLFRLSWLRAFIPIGLMPLESGSRLNDRESRNNGGRYGRFCFKMGRVGRWIVGLPRKNRAFAKGNSCLGLRSLFASSFLLVGSSSSSFDSAGNNRSSPCCVFLCWISIGLACSQISYQSMTLGSRYFGGPVQNENRANPKLYCQSQVQKPHGTKITWDEGKLPQQAPANRPSST